MESPCSFCFLRRKSISNVSYDAIVDAFIQITSYLKLKANSGEYLIIIKYYSEKKEFFFYNSFALCLDYAASARRLDAFGRFNLQSSASPNYTCRFTTDESFNHHNKDFVNKEDFSEVKKQKDHLKIPPAVTPITSVMHLNPMKIKEIRENVRKPAPKRDFSSSDSDSQEPPTHVVNKKVKTEERDSDKASVSEQKHTKTNLVNKVVCNKVVAPSLQPQCETPSKVKPLGEKVQQAETTISLKIKRTDVIDNERMPRKLYSCNVCDKKFPLVSMMKMHIRQHHGNEDDDELTCECGKILANKASFARHINMHTKETLTECDVCHKEFHDKSTLRRHKLIHTGVKKFACDKCDKKYTRKDKLKAHVIAHHGGDEIFTCSICSKKFMGNDAFSQHSKIHENTERTSS